MDESVLMRSFIIGPRINMVKILQLEFDGLFWWITSGSVIIHYVVMSRFWTIRQHHIFTIRLISSIHDRYAMMRRGAWMLPILKTNSNAQCIPCFQEHRR